jgi:putative SOS response-associated peptidase YedK
MCGRYSLFADPTDVRDALGLATTPDIEARYNCAPGQSLPTLRDADDGALSRAEWGLQPAWADDPEGLINARVETVAEKPSFRAAYERRRPEGAADLEGPVAGRCVVPADGFYEWVETDDGKRPYRVAFADDRPFAMAGLWTAREVVHEQTGLGAFAGGGDAGPETERVETFTVLTTEPNDVVAELHHRMAVLLDPDEVEGWLRGDLDAAAVAEPYPGAEMRAYPVSTRVNSPANDDPSLVEPV